MAAPKVVFEKIAALEVPFHAHAPNDYFFDEDARSVRGDDRRRRLGDTRA